MRIIAIATVCALTATIPAQAQQVETIKARGANAAGACAGSLDMLGQYMSRADNPNTQRLQEIQQARDFFSDMPRFPREEIATAARSFVAFMSGRIRNAKTVEERQAIQRELLKVSNGCFASAKAELRAFRESAPNAAPAQPYTAQPAQPDQTYETVPLQPYTTEPLTLDPVTPAQ